MREKFNNDVQTNYTVNEVKEVRKEGLPVYKIMLVHAQNEEKRYSLFFSSFFPSFNVQVCDLVRGDTQKNNRRHRWLRFALLEHRRLLSKFISCHEIPCRGNATFLPLLGVMTI